MFGWQQNVSMTQQPSVTASADVTSSFSQHHNRLPPPPPPPRPPLYEACNDALLAKRMGKPQRRVVDYTSAAVNYLQVRSWQRDERDRTVLQPTSTAVIDMLPPVAYTDNPSTSFAANFVCASINKNKCPIYRVVWTPTGRRLITGAQTGEFTLWNGQSFNFEMILQAHDKPVRSMVWSHNENWMVTGDDGGTIKYWQSNMNNVKANNFSHKESVHDISFSSTDMKFCSCSNDTTIKVWDFASCQEERSLTGHDLNVKCADWHPKKSLIASGGKDNMVKLWDAKSGRELRSFHGHENMVLSVKWNQNGNWLLTSSKDQIIKLYDIRSMKELESFRGHQKEVTVLAWHPYHEEYFVSGSCDGSIIHWLVGHDGPQVEIIYAHEGSVCDLAWHPTGYLLCSGSKDRSTKFWCRNRPGNTAKDQYTSYNPGAREHHPNFSHVISGFPSAADAPLIPGPFAPGLFHNQGTIPGIGVAVPLNTGGEQRPIIPGLTPRGVAPPLPPGPPPSHLMPNQQQNYQQFQPQQQQQQFQLPHQFQQQIGQMHNFQMPLHQRMPQNQMGMQGSGNQMMTAMQQGNVMSMSRLHGGQPTPHISPNPNQFPNGLPNIHGPQNFMFNLQQMGQMPQTPRVNNFQPGMIPGGNMGPPPPPQPPLPPGPAPK